MTSLSLRREEYRDLSHPDYVRRWRNRWDAGVLASYVRTRYREHWRALHDLLAPDTLPRRLMSGIGEVFVRGGLLLALAGANCLRWFDMRRLFSEQIGRWKSRMRPSRTIL